MPAETKNRCHSNTITIAPLLTCGAALPPDRCKTPRSTRLQDASELGLYSRVAHHPWRDRNSKANPRSRLPSSSLMSLITPGGIATTMRGICRRPRYPVAHHPWRDRNALRTPDAGGPSPRRSSPLEGSQPVRVTLDVDNGDGVAHHPWRDRNSPRTGSARRAVTRRSSPLEGSQLQHHPHLRGHRRRRSSPLEGSQPGGGRRAVGGDRRRRSSPLEGSQPEEQPEEVTAIAPASLITPGGIATTRGSRCRTAGHWVAHHPWRDRNSRAMYRSTGVPASLITPGGIATLAGRPRPAIRGVAHHPWRDRNPSRSTASRHSRSRSSPLEGSQP